MIPRKIRQGLCYMPPLLYSASSRFYFSLSESALRAIWANQVIKKISLGQVQNQDQLKIALAKRLNTETTLQRQIMNLNIDSQVKKSKNDQLELIKKARSDIIQKYFQEGFQINSEVFHQDRFSQAGKRVSSNKPKKFVFIPTYAITGQIFSIYQHFNHDTYIIYGQKGISKSTAFSLLYYLKNEISAFKIKQHRNEKEIEEVRKIVGNFQKVIFWSIKPLEFNELKGNKPEAAIKLHYLKDLANCLISQCSDIYHLISREPFFQKLNQKIKGISKQSGNVDEAMSQLWLCLDNLVARVHEIYKEHNIEITLIVDQVNNFTNLIRRSKSTIKAKTQSRSWHRLKKQPINLANQGYKKAYFFRSILRLLMRYSKYHIFSSSLELQEDILTFKENNMLGMKLRDRPKKQIYFSEMKVRDLVSRELPQFFEFELSKTNLSHLQKEEARKLYAESHIAKFFTPLNLRELVQCISANSISIMKIFFDKFRDQKEEEIIEEVQNHMKKVSKSNESLLVNRDNITKTLYKFLLLHLGKESKGQILKLNLGSARSQSFLMNSFNKQYFLFRFQEKEGNKPEHASKDKKATNLVQPQLIMQTDLPVDLVQKIYWKIYTHGIKEQFTNKFNDWKNFFKSGQGAVLGCAFEHLFLSSIADNNNRTIKILRCYNTETQIQRKVIEVSKTKFLKNMSSGKLVSQLQQQLKHIEINQPTLFVPLAQESFKSLQSVHDVMLYPNLAQNVASNNCAFDCLIIRKEAENKVKLSFIQLSTASQIKTKLEKSIKSIKSIPAFKKGTININGIKCSFSADYFFFHKRVSQRFSHTQSKSQDHFIRSLSKYESRRFSVYYVDPKDVSILNGFPEFVSMYNKVIAECFQNEF